MNVRVRPRRIREEPSDPVQPEQALAAPSANLELHVHGAPAARDRFEVPILLGTIVAALGAWAISTDPMLGSPLALATALGCGIHLLVGRPIFRVVRNLAAESKRLRAALTCPYCRDQLPKDSAMACDRTGCGTFYHEECWEECSASYGGCAIYGCGSTSGHTVGRFALQRRVLRLVLATVLFPPKIVKRLRESETESLSGVARRSRAYQDEVSSDRTASVLVGAWNLLVSLGLLLALFEFGLDVKGSDTPEAGVMLFMILIIVLPIVLMRMPLAGHFTWFASRAIARVFRDELAALNRADQGTFLARLASHAGKKA